MWQFQWWRQSKSQLSQHTLRPRKTLEIVGGYFVLGGIDARSSVSFCDTPTPIVTFLTLHGWGTREKHIDFRQRFVLKYLSNTFSTNFLFRLRNPWQDVTFKKVWSSLFRRRLRDFSPPSTSCRVGRFQNTRRDGDLVLSFAWRLSSREGRNGMSPCWRCFLKEEK